MSFTPNFSSSQSSGNLRLATLTDTSTGTDGTLTGRSITIRKYDGTYLVPNGNSSDTTISWAIGDTSIDLDILDKDYCVDITVTWLAGSTAADTKTILTLFTGYDDVFLRKLTQALAGNKTTITQTNFWVNKNKLRVLMDDASQAVSLLNDQTIAQFCLDEAKKLSDNLSSFF